MQQRGKSMEVIYNFYIDRKVLIFFENVQLFYVIFKSYPSLLKSPDFMTLGVSSRVSLSRLCISCTKSEITHQWSVTFQTSFLSHCPYFLLPGCIFTFLNFWSFTIYFLFVKKSIVNEKGIVNETTYKSLSRN